MAKQSKNDAMVEAAAAGGGGTVAMVGLAMAAVALGLAVALPSVLLLVIGMSPTLVALLVDDSDSFGARHSVCALNLCGVVPIFSQLWTGNHSLDGLVAIMSDIYTWFFMYGAAALGWLLYLAMPTVLTILTTVRDERRVERLRASQQELVRDWGPSVGRLIEGADNSPPTN